MSRPSETDNTLLIGQPWNGLYRDRYSYDRETLLSESIKAWRLNPLARRLTNLYKIYNIDGISFHCDHPATDKFLRTFWDHELNAMDEMLTEISNELFLCGNVFPLFSIDSTGMTYVRIFPTDQIAEIITADNDVKQELEYITRSVSMLAEPRRFKNPRWLSTLSNASFMTHHKLNALAGTCWGEGEIWSDLPWLSRYATWLEDRVRLNHFRSSFMYVVQGQYKSEADKRKRQAELNANPPRPGTVLVTDPSEQWGIMSANLDSFDASIDGEAIKKMIAVNHVPMHYLAEAESSTRTTADAAGTPTFKGFEDNQRSFKKIIHSILTIAVKARSLKDDSVSANAVIEITSADASERDNAALALAISQMVTSIGEIYDRNLIDQEEYLRLVYRFGGENPPKPESKLKGIRRIINAPAVTVTNPNPKPATASGAIKVDSASGVVKIKEPIQ